MKDDLRKETEQQISQVKDELKTLWISEQLKFLSVKIVHPSITFAGKQQPKQCSSSGTTRHSQDTREV